MSHKFITTVALALALLLVAPPLVWTAAETVFGLVQEVEMDKERLVITTETDETRSILNNTRSIS